MKQYYQMTGEETIMEVNGSLEPLTDEQVLEHQEKYGPNELVEGKKKTVLQIFLEQYKDFLVIILIIAAIVSGFIGEVESTAVILIVITMNAILGTVQTVKAEQSLASLKKHCLATCSRFSSFQSGKQRRRFVKATFRRLGTTCQNNQATTLAAFALEDGDQVAIISTTANQI